MMMSSDNESGITAAGPYPSLLPDATQQPVGVDVSSTATTSEARLRDGDSSNNDSSDNYSFDDDDDDDDDGGNSEDDDGANESSSVPQAMVSTGLDWEAGEQERKEQKEKFILFTKTLMESLEKEDLALHAKVKATMDDCKKRSEQGELGYEYVTTSMRIRLKEAVNPDHWKRAETDLEKPLVQKEEERRQQEEEMRRKREGIRYRYGYDSSRRKAEKYFSLFYRVLVKYLEQKDPTLQAKVEANIKECVKQKRQEGKRAFNPDINGIKSRLRELVSDDHWKGADMWVDNFEKVLAGFRAEVGVIARFADKATSFLQSLPVDPMSQVLVDIALSEVLYKDPLLQVVKLFVQKRPETPKTPRACLLLHCACSGGASFDVLQYLIEIYPQGLNGLRDKKGGNWYPLQWQWRKRHFEKDHGERAPEELLKSFINACQTTLGPADFMDWLHVQVRAAIERGSVADTASLLRQSPPDAVSWALTHRDETDRLIIEHELAKCEATVSTEELSLLIAHAPGCLKESTGALGQTPLHSAVSHDNQWAVKIILTGYDKALWQRDIYGRLPLHVAVMAGASLGVLELLIDSYPAALWTRDNEGYVPLHHAFHMGPERVGWWTPSCSCKKRRLCHAGITHLLGVVGLLVRHHEDAHQSLWIGDNNGRLPLHHAVVEDGRLVDFLIQMGPMACKSVDCWSRLPLHVALESQASKKTVEVLLDHHDLVQLEQRDGQGRLPFQVACESNCSLAVMYLLVRRAPHLVHDVIPARSWT